MSDKYVYIYIRNLDLLARLFVSAKDVLLKYSYNFWHIRREDLPSKILFLPHIVTFVPVFSSQRRDLSFNPRRVLVARFSLGFNGEPFEYSKHGQFLVVGAGPFTRISSLASEVYIYIYRKTLGR